MKSSQQNNSVLRSYWKYQTKSGYSLSADFTLVASQRLRVGGLVAPGTGRHRIRVHHFLLPELYLFVSLRVVGRVSFRFKVDYLFTTLPSVRFSWRDLLIVLGRCWGL